MPRDRLFFAALNLFLREQAAVGHVAGIVLETHEAADFGLLELFADGVDERFEWWVVARLRRDGAGAVTRAAFRQIVDKWVLHTSKTLTRAARPGNTNRRPATSASGAH